MKILTANAYKKLADHTEIEDDLTIANARLKRVVEQQRREIASLNLRCSNLQRNNDDLLGEHGVDNAKAVIAALRRAESEVSDLRSVIKKIIAEIPDEFLPES